MAFVETRWSMVLRAGLDTDEGREALNTLCQQYIRPLYVYLRKVGYGVDQSEEYLQSFFAKLIERNFVAAADPERGRFRSFLLTALIRSVQNDKRDSTRIKRGGHVSLLSLSDYEFLESIPDNKLSPDQHYERQWALALLERALKNVEEEYASRGKGEIFQEMHGVLALNEKSLDYSAVGARLGLESSRLRVLAHRLRKDFRRHVLSEIYETVENPDDVQEELAYLYQALSGTATL